MCGIVACQITSPALDYLLPALARLEYRGYDSAGVSVQNQQGEVVRLRSVGRLVGLERVVGAVRGPDLDGVGIGHTRWATHGLVSEANSHPHVDCTGAVHVVHNGIIENADELRAVLVAGGHRMSTDVDSETVAHLVEDALAAGADLATAVETAAARLRGSWALAVMRRDLREVVVTAHHSPLLVGHGDAGAFAASDATALAGWAERLYVLDDGDIAVLRAAGIEWRVRKAGSDPASPGLLASGFSASEIDLGGASDYMAKEIAEQPLAVARTVDRLGDRIGDGSLWRGLGLPALERVRFVACGTSLNAATVLARLLAEWRVPSTLAPASELDSVVLEPGTLTIALSQSGESADVLRALERSAGGPVLALTNVAHSTLGRSADAVLELGAGPEVGVAATKTFTAQVVTGASALLAGLVESGRLDRLTARVLVNDLRELPKQLTVADELARERCAATARAVAEAPGFLLIGRGAAVPYVAEGALKLKELTYRWAEHYAAGELKHGPIALVERGTPVVALDDGDAKLPGNVAEVRARQARVLCVGGPDTDLPYRRDEPTRAPWGPLPAVVVLQHLARELALVLGRDVDKPRNLAKSVTVE
jgi:glucosamine--fructose-6-phosphate aminotransferase (isomerizing)